MCIAAGLLVDNYNYLYMIIIIFLVLMLIMTFLSDNNCYRSYLCHAFVRTIAYFSKKINFKSVP